MTFVLGSECNQLIERNLKLFLPFVIKLMTMDQIKIDQMMLVILNQGIKLVTNMAFGSSQKHGF